MIGAVPASAHTSLIDVQPGEGETVAEGTTVSLTFSEALLDLGTEVIATDASGESFPLGVERPEPAMVAAELPALAEGPVTVSWRVVAGDGHPIEGTLGYVAGADDAGDDVPASTAPATASSQPEETPRASPDQGVTGEETNLGLSPAGWLAIGALILAAAIAGVVAKKRR